MKQCRVCGMQTLKNTCPHCNCNVMINKDNYNWKESNDNINWKNIKPSY